MSFDLYDASIVVMLRNLNNLKKFVKQGEAWLDEQGKPHSVVLDHKFAPDMLDFKFQVQTATKPAGWVLHNICGAPEVKWANDEKTFADLYARIDKGIELLSSVKREDLKDVDKPVLLTFPGAELKFTSQTFIQRWVLPHFFFHMTTAYLLMRNVGVPLGKADFIDHPTIQEP